MSSTIFLPSGQTVDSYAVESNQGGELYSSLRQVFPKVLTDTYQTISQEHMHEALGHRVMRTCLMTQDSMDMIGREAATLHRLFDLDALTSVLYSNEIFTGEKPSCLSPGTFVMSRTEHFEEYGRPCSDELLSFCEYFFIAPLDEIQGFYGLSIEQIPGRTVFGALVRNGEIVSVRRYTDMSADGGVLLGNWQGVFVLHAKKARRMDLARTLLNLEYLGLYE